MTLHTKLEQVVALRINTESRSEALRHYQKLHQRESQSRLTSRLGIQPLIQSYEYMDFGVDRFSFD
jgi:hypothetical protein